MQGFFKVYRSIFEHDIWENPLDLRLFLLIVGKAVWKDEYKYHEDFELKRGQWIRSIRKLQQDLEYKDGKKIKRPGLATIKRSIERLTSNGMVTTYGTEYGTLFTVVNYAKYQDLEPPDDELRNTLRNDSGTEAERSRNNKKNVKNEKNVIDSSSREEEEEKSSNKENPFVMYQKCFGKFPTPIIIEEINYYLDEGMENRLVAFAIYKASKGGFQFSYANGILRSWQDEGIYTYEAALEKDNQHKRKNMQVINGGNPSNNHKKNVRKDKVPPWIQEDSSESEQENELSEEEAQEKREKLQQMLSKYKK